MLTGGEIMVKCLEAEGVDILFGYPGAAICPFYDALYDSPIRHVLVRSEQNAAHMASGYARASGRPGVCVATSGPGATNLITGIATAYMDSIPIVAITGQVNLEQLGRDVFQEADITGACESFTKHSYLVKSVEDLPRVFKEAFHIASTGRPGPVLIDVPEDVQEALAPSFSYPEKADIPGYKPKTAGHPVQLKRALEAIGEARRPIICCGGGVVLAGAREEMTAFAEKSGIPIVSTMMGIGVMPMGSPVYLGMIGRYGRSYANRAIGEADLIILCGARVGDRAIALPNQIAEQARTIHIDIDPAEIGKNMRADIPIVGDARQVLNALAEQVPYLCCEDWLARLVDLRSRNSTKSLGSDEAYVNPKEFFLRLSEKAPDNAVLTADVGQNQIWAANYYKVKRGRFLTSGGMGTMGYAIPAAAGVQTADPSRTVMAVCGDGGFQMSMMELGTIAYYKLPVKIIALNNHFLGMVKELQDRGFGRRETAVELGDKPDIAALAGCYNIPSKKLTSMAECDGAIQWLLSTEGPCLLECLVHPDESTL